MNDEALTSHSSGPVSASKEQSPFVGNSTQNIAFCQEALHLAAQGFAVFPLKPSDKTPLIRNWPAKVTTDENVIKSWGRYFPTSNIAIACEQSSLIVLDVDPRHGGEESLRELERRYGPLPETVEVITGGGGRHLYFKKPQNVRIKNGVNLAGLSGLDIRADGGYVVAPPSIHPNGQRYAWKEGHSPEDIELAPAPQWLIDLVTGHARGAKEAANSFSKEIDCIPEGMRNNALASVAGSLRKYGSDEATIKAALLAVNQVVCSPPLDEQEVSQIARSISKYPPGERQSTDVYQRYTPAPNAPDAPAQWLTASEIFGMAFSNSGWIVDGLVPAGLTFIAGRPKIGKSWLALELAQSVAVGKDFLERKVRQGSVIYLALEDSPGRIRKRMLTQGWSGNEPVHFCPHFSFKDTDQAVNELRQKIEETGAVLVVIDSLRAALQDTAIDENDARVANLLYPFASLAQEQGVAIVFVHHHTKLQMRDPGLDLRGSSAIFAAADAVIGLYRELGERTGQFMAQGRDYEEDVNEVLEFSEGKWQVATEQIKMTGAEQDILAVLDDLGEADAQTLAGALGMTRQAVTGHLRKMIERGIVEERREKLKRGGFRVYYSRTPPHSLSTVSTVSTVAPVSTDGDSGSNGSNGSNIPREHISSSPVRPALPVPGDLNDIYDKEVIMRQDTLILPGDIIELPNGDQHTVAYCKSDGVVLWNGSVIPFNQITRHWVATQEYRSYWMSYLIQRMEKVA